MIDHLPLASQAGRRNPSTYAFFFCLAALKCFALTLDRRSMKLVTTTEPTWTARLPDIEIAFSTPIHINLKELLKPLLSLPGTSINIRNKSSLQSNDTLKISQLVNCDFWNRFLPSGFNQSIASSLAMAEVENSLATILKNSDGFDLRQIQFLHNDLCRNETSTLNPQMCRASSMTTAADQSLDSSIERAKKLFLSMGTDKSLPILCYDLNRTTRPSHVVSILQCNSQLSGLPMASPLVHITTIPRNISIIRIGLGSL